MKMKVHRDYISKEQLVKAAPVGRWFGFESVDLDIIKSSFDRRMRNMPRAYIEWRVIGKSNQFRIKDGRLTELLAMFKTKPKPRKTKARKVVEDVARIEKEAKEQALFDLVMNA